MYRSLALVALALSACGPQNAQIITGDYQAFLPTTGSLTVRRDNIDYADFPVSYSIDCRNFDNAVSPEDNERLRLDNRIPVCPGDQREDGSVVSNDDWPLDYEYWADEDGYIVFGDELTPWRGEAIITSEGDVQLYFHQELNGGENFRFGMVVDPNFQPVQCVGNEDGTAELVDVDGNWLQGWSDALGENARLFLLTANATQISAEYRQWFYPQQWGAGYAGGELGNDRLGMRSIDFGDPRYMRKVARDAIPSVAAIEYESEVCGDNNLGGACNGDPYFPNVYFDVAQSERYVPTDLMIAQASEDAALVAADWEILGLPPGDEFGVTGNSATTPFLSNNLWREPEGRPFDPRFRTREGMKGWMGLHYNWVVFDGDPAFETGETLTGRFNIILEGLSAPLVVVARGTFEIPNLKKDTWTMEFLPEIKLEENNTILCGDEDTGIAPE